MQNKSKDTLYCGVDKHKIASAKPVLKKTNLNLFMYYIQERYSIHLKKDVYSRKPPWTKDAILKRYRFTNVRREQDKESQWVIQNIAENNFLTYRQKLLNIVLFRMFNKHETLEIIEAPFYFTGAFNYAPAKNKLINFAVKHPEYHFFSNAFLASGMKLQLHRKYPKEDFAPANVLHCLKDLNENGLIDDISSCKNPQEVCSCLCKDITGIGNFLAYQIFVDFTYIDDFPFSENEFVIVGPGCKNGLALLFDNTDGLTDEGCLFWLKDNWYNLKSMVSSENWFDPKKQMVDLKHCDRVMNVMSLENCCCEFSKYYKTFLGLGRPRSVYKMRKESNNGRV